MTKNQAISEGFTHRGWLGFCPVYLRFGYEIDGEIDGVELVERHVLLLPIFVVSEGIFGIINAIYSLIDPEMEGFFPVCITGELHA